MNTNMSMKKRDNNEQNGGSTPSLSDGASEPHNFLSPSEIFRLQVANSRLLAAIDKVDTATQEYEQILREEGIHPDQLEVS